MKEFGLDLMEYLNRGLAVHGDEPANTPGLEICHNVKPTQRGLRKHTHPERGFSSVDVDWPYPQVFRGSQYHLLARESGIYRINIDQTLSPIYLYDYNSGDRLTDVSPRGGWHFLDHGKGWTLFSENLMIYKMYKERLLAGVDTAQVQSDIWARTGASFKGRTVWGGFTPGHFWTSEWKSYWEDRIGDWPTTDVGVVNLSVADRDLSPNFVMWSEIGGNLWWLLYRSMVMEGMIEESTYGSGYDTDEPLLHDMLKRNEFGWMPMPWNGYVEKMLPLGDYLVVYGVGGVSVLQHSTEPVPTLGLVPIGGGALPGVMGRNAAASGVSEHIYLDRYGDLWKIGLDLSIQRLGYSKYLKPMVKEGSEVVVTYNVEEDEYYICSENYAFVLTKQGLATMDRLTTTVYQYNERVRSVYDIRGETSQVVTTTPFNMGNTSIKSLQSIEVGGRFGGLRTRVLSRMNGNQQFTKGGLTKSNDEGVSYNLQAGKEFKVALVGQDDKFGIDSLKVNWKQNDKRHIRGLRAD